MIALAPIIEELPGTYHFESKLSRAQITANPICPEKKKSGVAAYATVRDGNPG